ncbi:hypothetical protein, partial [Brachyspira hampsonii]|uniref:hypothetical protein n=1 Tax=Brachyspira hampsonii TaxID=1287055 RepID=UPI0027E42813
IGSICIPSSRTTIPFSQASLKLSLRLILASLLNFSGCEIIIEKSNAKGGLRQNNDYPFYFDDNEAKRPITFIQSLVHTKGEWANHNIILEPWEQFIIESIFLNNKSKKPSI